MSDLSKAALPFVIAAGAIGYLLGRYAPTWFSSTLGPKYLHPQQFTSAVMEYTLKVGMREHPALQELREATSKLPRAFMMSSPDEANFLGLLAKILDAKKVIEVGVYTGYGTLSIALGLPANGQILALDINEEYVAIGRPFWKKAGVEDKIQVKIAPATETLAKLLADGEAGTYDMAFVDADKPNYINYFEALLPLLRQGGVIVFDNMLWSGKVATNNNEPNTVALRRLNTILKNDPRVEIAMLVMADGVTIVRKK